jgi:F420-dependent oxidoreductase-like protein
MGPPDGLQRGGTDGASGGPAGGWPFGQDECVDVNQTMQSGARFSVVLGQRLPWPEMLAHARETEVLGFDGLFLVDHFYGLFDVMQETHEAYTMLAALAPFTQRIRLGVMVCGNTYRNPAFLLKQAMTVDHISGGRVDFGVGAGWVQREHEAYGWEYPSAKERVDRFSEALEIWRLLQTQERTTYEGKHYRLVDAPFEPKSLQPGGMPVLIGGSGPRMLRLTARYAAIWNAVGSPEEVGELSLRLDEACEEENRDPASLVRSVSPSINLLASAAAFEEGVRAYWAAGIRDICFPWPRVEREVPVLREVARDVLPRLRGVPAQGGAARPPAPSRRSLGSASEREIHSLMEKLEGSSDRLLLLALIARPGERQDGTTLMDALGLARHEEVAKGFGRLGGLFERAGFDRPWVEAQRGWSISAELAERLARAGLPRG